MGSLTRIKLCGLGAPEQVDLARALGADFIGLIFAEHSRRRLTVEAARRVLEPLGARQVTKRSLLHEGIPPAGWFQRCATGLDAWLAERRPLVVGVFVDQPPALVNAIAELLALDLVQLSGNEPWAQALEIRRPVIKTIHVEPHTSARDVIAQCEYGTAVLPLLDTAVPGAAGGTGTRFDWSVAVDVAAQLPSMLAGGLTPETVAEAIALVDPWAVDVSSGIESNGVKDLTKMRAFIDAARRVPIDVNLGD